MIGRSQLQTMSKGDKHYALGLTFLFLVVGAFTASHHEMWRDEIQAWLLARDSTSVFDLFAHLKYEGHPGLWHLCLMPLSRITHSPVIMQMFHLLITGVTVYLFVRYSPFNWFQKLLFCFGYLVLYEYAIVARNYALGLLLITVFCVLFKERYKRFIWVGCVLFLLAHTSVHALIITIAIGGVLCCEYSFGGRFLNPLNQEIEAIEDKRPIWIGFALIGIGILTAILQLNPPPDTGFAVAWNFNFETKRVNDIVKLISRAYLPVTRPVFGFLGFKPPNNLPRFFGNPSPALLFPDAFQPTVIPQTADYAAYLSHFDVWTPDVFLYQISREYPASRLSIPCISDVLLDLPRLSSDQSR